MGLLDPLLEKLQWLVWELQGILQRTTKQVETELKDIKDKLLDLEDQNDDLTWMQWIVDGCTTERWEQGKRLFNEFWKRGFRKILYHGRTGAYYKSDSASGVPFKDWVEPEILQGVSAMPYPWNNVLRMRNAKPGSNIVDELYVGLPKAMFRGAFNFIATLPDPTGLHNLYIGWEVNSGGSFALLLCLALISGTWYLWVIDKQHSGGRELTKAVTLRHLGVESQYCLMWLDDYLELYESRVGVPNAPWLELTAQLPLEGVHGKGIPFFANEHSALCEFLVGNFWVNEIEKGYPKGSFIDLSAVASTDAYQYYYYRKMDYSALELYMKCITKNVTVKVDAAFDSYDGSTYDIVVVAEASLVAAAAPTLTAISVPYPFIRVGYKSTVAGQVGAFTLGSIKKIL